MTYRTPDPDHAEELARAETQRQASEQASDLATIAAMKRGNRASFRFVRALVALVVVSAIALPLLLWLAILLVPTKTDDGHVVMPIGQAAFAMILAPVLGLIAAWLAGRPPSNGPRS